MALFRKPSAVLLVAVVSVTLLSACASLRDIARHTFENPTASIAGAKISHLSFDEIGLLFDVTVKNPNIIGVQLSGFGYDFMLNDKSVLQGNQSNAMNIKSQSESKVQVPVTLRFRDLYKSLIELRYRDQFDYLLNLTLSMKAPVLGTEFKIPVSKEGSIPLPKVPGVSIESVQLKRLGVSGADLTLKLKVDNRNVFGFGLKKFNFALQVAGKQWLRQTGDFQESIAAKGSRVLSFPLSLNFFEIGRSVFSLVNSSDPLDYRLEGQVTVETASPLIGAATVPFNYEGQFRVSR